MRSLKGTFNKYARKQVRREINSYVRSLNGNSVCRKVEEDKFTGSTVWEYIKWIFEPEKM
jgi:hypothetical protein